MELMRINSCERERSIEKINKRRILFFIPPFPARTYPGKTMGPDYLGGYLKSKGLIDDFEVLDLEVLLNNNRLISLEDVLLSQSCIIQNADVIGISYLSFQANEAMKIGELCNEILRGKNKRDKNSSLYVPIIAGGRGVTDAGGGMANGVKFSGYADIFPNVDFFVTGKEFFQPFDTMADFFESLIIGKNINEIRRKLKGIVLAHKKPNQTT